MTDLAAIYLGAGNHMARGYYLGSNVVQSTNKTTTTVYRLGYLTKEELEYAIKRINELYRNHVKSEEARLTKKTDEVKKALDTLEISILNNRQLMGKGRHVNIMCEEDRLRTIVQLYSTTHFEEDTDALQQFRQCLIQSSDERTLNSIRMNAEKKKGILDSENIALAQYIRIAEFQSQLSDRIKEYFQEIAHLSDSGNAFAIYEKMKFYCANPDSLDDAHALFDRLAERTDADAYFVMGNCYREGIAVKQNNESAGYYYYNAWINGSKEARTKLDELGMGM